MSPISREYWQELLRANGFAASGWKEDGNTLGLSRDEFLRRRDAGSIGVPDLGVPKPIIDIEPANLRSSITLQILKAIQTVAGNLRTRFDSDPINGGIRVESGFLSRVIGPLGDILGPAGIRIIAGDTDDRHIGFDFDGDDRGE